MEKQSPVLGMKATKLARKQWAPCRRFNVKLSEDSDPDRSRGMLSRVSGVQSVIQTFPEEIDEELKRLFVLEIEPSELESALKELRAQQEGRIFTFAFSKLQLTLEFSHFPKRFKLPFHFLLSQDRFLRRPSGPIPGLLVLCSY